MKKIFILVLLFSLFGEMGYAQKEKKEDRSPNYQFGVNASQLIGQITGIDNPQLTRSNLYDLHFTYTPKKVTYRIGLGHQAPEDEIPSGAVDENNNINYTLHFRFGIGWNKKFLEKWVLTTGPDFIHSHTENKEFKQDELTNHFRVFNTGFGLSSNLQYYFTPQFSIGVEIALYNSVSQRKQIFPEVLNPNQVPFTGFFNSSPALQIRMFAPVELFVYYKF